MTRAGFALERAFWARGLEAVAGVDEAGRGAWAGPVVAAVVVLREADELPYRDSKALSPAARERLAAHVRATARAWAVGEADAGEVDALGPLRATHVAAHRAIAALGLVPDAYVTDYLKLEFASGAVPLVAPPRADATSWTVAAASILAKTHRDARMRAAAAAFPGYGFDRHKGYGAPAHRAALAARGPCLLHRRSYRPVAACAASLLGGTT
ncbi:MAG: ribonuclease HII [Trueperaceae bacterium]|nr:ribonuclease HII [Trueperaceae bacterium]